MSLLRHVPEVAALVNEFRSQRLLDYGCGDGTQYSRERCHVVFGVDMPVLYEPGKALFSSLPTGQFDGVICIDYLDTLAPDLVPEALAKIAWYARQWAFIAARGEGWQEKIAPFFRDDVRLVIRETK